MGVPQDVQDTLRMLKLARVNNMTLVLNTPPIQGMLQKAKDYITWGEPTREVIAELLRHRGRVASGRPIDREALAKMGFDSIEALAEALYEGKVSLDKPPLKGVIKPAFRLRPPKKGWKGSIKRPFKVGGALGYRGKAINDLLLRMI